MKASQKVWVDRRSVGGPQRVGEIVEVLGEPGHVRYRVRWKDGRESIVYPGRDAALSKPRLDGQTRDARRYRRRRVDPRVAAPTPP